MKPLINTTKEELKELGKSSFAAKTNPGLIYQTLFNLTIEDQCGERYTICYGENWGSFYSGWHEEYIKYLNQRRIDLKVDEFLEKLQTLCDEYKAYIYTGPDDDGCACIDDYDFSIQTKQICMN